MRKIVSATVAAAFLGLVSALAAPRIDVKTDYTALPPPPADVQKQVSASKVSLAQAIDTAQKEVKGLAKSAIMRLNDTPPVIEVLVYAGDNAHKIIVNAESGAIISQTIVPRLPGEPFEGELVENESGLKYADLCVGTGEEIIKPDTVVQGHLEGYLVDGTQFINTREREPMLIPLDQIFPGFMEGATGMKVGGKRKLVIPPALALGEAGQPPTIPANATLIFDLEVLAFNWELVPPVAELPGDPVQGEPVTTPSGLQYYEIKAGEGPQPTGPTNQVKVHYTGWLVNGTKFDSSVDRGQPMTFPLNGVIAGWTEGVGNMKVGGKRKLVVPAKLAYGEAGRPGIPPNALLIFDVELLEATEAPPPSPSPPAATNPSPPVNPGRPDR